ncbi:MAG: putative porin [Parabacteroides sp.]|nr:putative porin [Parabacteroides sp.]
MNSRVCIWMIWMGLCSGLMAWGQGPRGGRSERGGFSLANLSAAQKEIPDSLLLTDSAALKAKRLTAFHVITQTGARTVAPLDTNQLNFGQTTLAEGHTLGTAYLANVGSPGQSLIFADRPEARDFIFADPYHYYITTPENALFYDTKIPYTHVLYTTEGGSQYKNERFKGLLTWNFGKKINLGGEMDYIYSRGHYNSNGNKLLSYRLFGSYHTDRYELNAYLSNFNFLNAENGGLTDDRYITNPDLVLEGSKRSIDTKAFPVRMTNTWNRVRGKQYFLSHRYNLGFYRTLSSETDSLGNPIQVFVPVSSLVHTVHYEDNRRHFLSEDGQIGSLYPRSFGMDSAVNDRSSAWKLRNTLALSMREGFQDWVKLGVTAFVAFEKRRFKLPAAIPGLDYDPNGHNGQFPTTLTFQPDEIHDEFTTYAGAEISKEEGQLLTYRARGELGVAGSDFGEIRINGELKTRFPLFHKEASITAEGSFSNVNPAFFQRHNHSHFFWWDVSLNKIQHLYAGAKIRLESTETQLTGGIHSVQNYVYFDHTGYPQQCGSNLQLFHVGLKQDFHHRALGWENELAYQTVSGKEKDKLPLPALTLYSNLYLKFKAARVLTIQLGADLHYYTAYDAPYYEPATQQFQLQDAASESCVKVGNYPLINAYVNFHLKQARFFIMGYNLGSKFINPNYFSLAHYPLNPMVLKMGIAVTFNN